MRDQFNQILLEFWTELTSLAPNLLAAFIIFLFFLLLGQVLYKIMNRRFLKKWKETIAKKIVTNVLRWLFYLFGAIAALDILNLGGVVSSLIAGAGITAIILGFAFKDIGENFLAGILLAVNRPFRIGNIIEVNGHKGFVRDMDLRTTHIRNVEGKDIFIPNAMIIKNIVINYTKDGLLRQEFTIGLDIPTNFENVKELILEYIAAQDEVLKNPAPNVITSEIAEFTVNITVMFWINILESKIESPAYLGMTIRSKILHEIKDLLLNNGINLPSQIIEHKNYQKAIDLHLTK